MLRNTVLTLWGLCLGLVFAAPQPVRANTTDAFADFRGLWVDRFDYRNGGAAGIQQIVDDAVSMGITDLIFQVRGQGDAYYNSNFEPRAEALTGSWDPLQTAIDAAHAAGIKLHAWMNTMPLWNGTTPPSTSTAIPHPFYHTNPSYRVQDINGNYQPLQSGYVIANPINPEWQQHINNVANDIVSNYDVDGIHLDYIRYVGSIDFNSLPHDAQSHAMFLAATGLDAANPANVGAYQQYIRDRITTLVTDVGTTIKATDPNVKLSAAVWRDPDIGANEYLQEYRTWLEQDLLDIAMPMIYLHQSNNNLLLPNITNTMNIETNTLIAPGLGPYLHAVYGDSTDLITQQLQTLYAAGANGSTMYDWGHLFNGTAYSAQQVENIINFINSTIVIDPPPGGTIVGVDDFEVDEGHFYASPTYSGSNRGIISATAERDTTQAHTGFASERIDVDGETDADGWSLRFLSGLGDPANNLVITADGWIGFWMMTTTPGLTVQIALDDPDSADRGIAQAVIADGDWHLYQWDMDNNSQWEAWAFSDGNITGPTLTIDSIFLHGKGLATVFLDDVAYNNGGSLTPGIDGDLDGDGFVGISDLNLILGNWNQNVTPGDVLMGDVSGDGFVGIDDLNLVLGNWNAGTPLPGARCRNRALS
ncbi:MAG: family 10 glycosylhydrolase [Phycisphaerales bacterium]